MSEMEPGGDKQTEKHSFALCLRDRRHFVLAPLFELKVFIALRCLFKLINANNTPKLTKITLRSVKIRYNRPAL